jgi:hypothetical protein
VSRGLFYYWKARFDEQGYPGNASFKKRVCGRKAVRGKKEAVESVVRCAEQPGQAINMDLCFVPETHATVGARYLLKQNCLTKKPCANMNRLFKIAWFIGGHPKP